MKQPLRRSLFIGGLFCLIFLFFWYFLFAPSSAPHGPLPQAATKEGCFNKAKAPSGAQPLGPSLLHRASRGELRRLYRLEQKIFRLSHQARGASLEAQRFGRDAVQSSLAAYRADFLRSAEAYQQQVLHYQKELLALRQQRQALLKAVSQKASRGP
jgi:hypothetical protein